jgi:hypothetical protein
MRKEREARKSSSCSGIPTAACNHQAGWAVCFSCERLALRLAFAIQDYLAVRCGSRARGYATNDSDNLSHDFGIDSISKIRRLDEPVRKRMNDKVISFKTASATKKIAVAF